MARKSNRRDFLRGRAAADALADRAAAALPAGGAAWPGERPGGYTLRIGRSAMACRFEVCLNVGQYEHGTETGLRALDLVQSLERQMSLFIDQSELCRINRTAAEGPVAVEPRLFALLEQAMAVYRETDGALDLTAGPLWEAWGFSRRTGKVPSREEIAEALSRTGSRFVELDAERRTVRFLREGIWLNLGAIGKGYALDRGGELLVEAGIEHFLFHGGQSSVLARGTQAVPAESPGERGEGWVVGLRHPIRGDRRIAETRLKDRAIGTSGSWAQSFRAGGRRYGHIIDPRTGRPADRVLSATAIAPDAALADALSTAFYVMGPEATGGYCAEHPEIGAVLACPVRHSGGLEIRSYNVADGELAILDAS